MKIKVLGRQANDDMCLVCGHANPLSVGADFVELENDQLVAFFTLRDEHQSYPGRAHGGTISAILDEVVGRAILVTEPESCAVTAEMNVKFKKPVPTGVRLMAIGRVVENRSRMFVGTGEILLPNGMVAASVEAKYVKLSEEKILQGGNREGATRNYKYLEDELPDFVDLPDEDNLWR